MIAEEEAAEAELVRARAAAEWSRGDAIQVVASAAQLDYDRYKVRGLDSAGHPQAPLAERAVDGVLDAFVDDGSGGERVAVRGDHPGCAAVGLYQAARFDHAWLVITTHRVAVLRLRDQQGSAPDPAELRQSKSVGGALRGLGKFVKDSATEFAKSVRRPPLAQRPEDAVLECHFELPRQALRAIERWKQPLTPEFRGAPRFLQVHFTDGSWARLQTTEAGQSRVLGG